MSPDQRSAGAVEESEFGDEAVSHHRGLVEVGAPARVGDASQQPVELQIGAADGEPGRGEQFGAGVGCVALFQR